MISNLLLLFFYYFFLGVITLFPNFTELPQDVDNAMNTISPYFIQAKAFVPMETLITILSSIILFETGLLTFKLINFVFKKLRGSG